MKSNLKIIEELENHLKILGYSYATYSTVKNVLLDFSEFIQNEYKKKGFNTVSKEEVSSYIEHLKNRDNKRIIGQKISAVHINEHILNLKRLSEFLWRVYQIQLPISHIRRLKQKESIRAYLSKEEIEKLYEVTHPTNRSGMRDRAILSVFYGCGLRRHEGEMLKVKDIDFKGGFIHVVHGKGNKERLVPMSKTVSKHLKEYIEVGRRFYIKDKQRIPFLFLSERGEPLTAQSLLNSFKKMKEKAMITKQVGIHSLRHSIATHLLDEGLELEEVSTFLGHSSLESTQIYTHIEYEKKGFREF